jgi:hypothetical protein
MTAYPCRDACRSRPHALRKGKGGWMQFHMSSLPYLISPFVKRPLIPDFTGLKLDKSAI